MEVGEEWCLAERFFGEREERKGRENEMKREKKLSKMKLVRVLNEVSLG